jgi:hypothetical protein
MSNEYARQRKNAKAAQRSRRKQIPLRSSRKAPRSLRFFGRRVKLILEGYF